MSDFGMFVPTGAQPRVRRARDAVGAITGALIVVWGVAGAGRESPLEAALGQALDALPSWALSILGFFFAFGLVYAAGIVVVMIAGGPDRRAGLRDVVVAVLVAVALGLLLAWAINGELPPLLPAEGQGPRFPVMRLVGITALLATASPFLSRPMRLLGWLIIVFTTVAAVGYGLGDLSDAAGGFGIGLFSASVVLLVAGSPRGYPDPATVAGDLRRLDVELEQIRIDPIQSWGVRRLVGTTPEGRDVAIKAYGRDATDSQWLDKAWRTLWYREGGRTVSYSRLQAVEHEALVTVLAERAGVAVPAVLAAGQASGEVALLALTDEGRTLRDLGSDEISDDTLVALWEGVGRLHSASISHGQLTTEVVRVRDDGPTIGDFTAASLVARESDRGEDVAELLFSLGLLVGADRAVAAALEGLGRDAMEAMLPYLQLPAVSRGTRRQADRPKELIKELQVVAAAAIGTTLPPPVPLRRVTGRNVAVVALVVLAAWALIPMIAGIDFAAVWGVLQAADWGLMIIALVVGHLLFITEAAGVLFAVGRPLPFWPLTSLQIAARFVGLAVPSVAGRIAMNAAFFHKFGMSATLSVTQGAIDSFSGFLVEIGILLIAFISGEVDLGVGADPESIDWALVLTVVGGAIVLVVIAVRYVERVRNWLLPVLRQVWEAFSGVIKEPGRALGLFGSNFATRLAMAATVWLVLVALGAPIGMVTALVVVVATNLLQGLVPVPGGVGVAEAAMTAFLVAVGVEESVAFAAAVSYRVITFYLPALEGFFTMRWLSRHEYL
jgi:glycosyltransferase 2 family protein